MKATTTLHHPLLIFFLILQFSVEFCVEGCNEEEDIKRSQFPVGFIFGAGTSSYQIEGAYLEDGSIRDGENGDIADDHYHRFLEDIEMMRSLGLNAYRFSISWTRVLPKGRFGAVNPSGILFYNKIIDNLLLRGIEPFVTIHHFDFPQELEERYGAWLSPLMQEEFVHFAEICFKNFGDRVKYWTTNNEPNNFAQLGYMEGVYPPARCSPPFGNCPGGNSDREPLVVMHNMLLAHAKAAKLYRQHFQPNQGGWIVIVVSSPMYEPLRDNELDREAASRALAFIVAWVLDPLVFGDYPPEMRRYHGNELPRFSSEETEYVKGSIDFIGVNQYSTHYAKDCLYSSCSPTENRSITGFVHLTGERDGVLIGEPMGLQNCYVVPRGMEEMVDYLKKRYHNMPMLLTENGYSPPEQQDVPLDELLHDVKRMEYHKAYLTSLVRAIRNGADVRGYFVWSLMDDFEWAYGYSLKFGLHYVDPQTLNRIPKLSAKWYKNFLSNRSIDYENLGGRSSC